MIPRIITPRLSKSLFQGRAILLFGARRVGKTTLVQSLMEQHSEKQPKYINCELLQNKTALEAQDAEPLKAFLGNSELVVLDEAQNVDNIGRTIKILVDTFPEIQIIATGSSSFDLANKTAESMAGRIVPFMLYPLSVGELEQGRGYGAVSGQLEALLRFGGYPEILGQSEETARERLDTLVSTYLYKDVLAFSGIKSSRIIVDLLQLLALQLGNEVSAGELANSLGIDRLTVLKYLDVLEQSFIVFSLRAFSRNLRKEVSKSFKVYFYDLGVRNSLIQAYNPLALRTDVGALWENFCIVERLKLIKYLPLYRNTYFWRTHDQKELDYIEEHDGLLEAFEFKWNPDATFKVPQDFLDAYPNSTVQVMNSENYWKHLLPQYVS